MVSVLATVTAVLDARVDVDPTVVMDVLLLVVVVQDVEAHAVLDVALGVALHVRADVEVAVRADVVAHVNLGARGHALVAAVQDALENVLLLVVVVQVALDRAEQPVHLVAEEDALEDVSLIALEDVVAHVSLDVLVLA